MEKRKIKFRVWDTKNMMFTKNKKNVHWNPETNFLVKHCSCILNQYTGLKDKNDKEIFDGDILKAIDMVVKVFFNDCMACWDIEFLGGDCERLVEPCGWNKDDWEVLGNIHENPELFK